MYDTYFFSSHMYDSYFSSHVNDINRHGHKRCINHSSYSTHLTLHFQKGPLCSLRNLVIRIKAFSHKLIKICSHNQHLKEFITLHHQLPRRIFLEVPQHTGKHFLWDISFSFRKSDDGGECAAAAAAAAAKAKKSDGASWHASEDCCYLRSGRDNCGRCKASPQCACVDGSWGDHCDWRCDHRLDTWLAAHPTPAHCTSGEPPTVKRPNNVTTMHQPSHF